jgi:hypothetical protein
VLDTPDMTNKALLVFGLIVVALAAAPKVAQADECLEVGWKTGDGAWSYYRAWIIEEDGENLSLRYDYKKGILELRVYDDETADGRDVTVLRGKWFEGKDSSRTGKVRMELEKGRRRAKGWYTVGDDSTRYDFALRECKR